MSFDDLFTDAEVEPLESIEVDQWGSAVMARQNDRIDAIVARNHATIEAADDHLKQAEHIRHSVFGDDSTYDEFISAVQHKLEHEEAFQQKHKKLAAVHSEVVESTRLDNRPYQAPERKVAAHRQNTFIPGQPVSRPVEAVTKRRNHILRKDMI